MKISILLLLLLLPLPSSFVGWGRQEAREQVQRCLGSGVGQRHVTQRQSLINNTSSGIWWQVLVKDGGSASY